MEEKLSVQWADFQNNISTCFGELRRGNDFADVTLACEDRDFEVHKLILSASSPFFKALLQRGNKQAHPMIYMRGVQAKDLEALVDFIYLGEAKIQQENLESFLAVAEELQLKGLAGLNAEEAFAVPQQPVRFDLNKTLDQHLAIDRKPKMLNGPNSSKDPDIKPKLYPTDSKIKSKLGQAENFKIKPDRTATTKDKVKPIIAEETARLVETLYTNLNGVYACLKCNYNSLQKGHLKEHVEKHIEGLRYPCNFCGKTSSSSQSLRGHLRKYH